MTDPRPDPDALLERARQEEGELTRGKLKVFLGAAPGVGKTYAMLETARARRREGLDVVVGWAETHGRKETAALLDGLEILPTREVEHRGVRLREFDLDLALRRKPALLLVDELAHTNAPGSRHSRRWQDVLELLDAGVSVLTTINVQHLESLNDVVAQITGVVVRETVPESVLERADEVELVDLPPDELLQRLKEGKVYVPEAAQRAVESFFRKGNLIALRELALRRTAERVDAQMEGYRRQHGVAAVWPANERLLVCVGPSPMSARVVRAAGRMARRLRSPWIAVHVETPAAASLSPRAREMLRGHLLLAESLGGRTAILSGPRVADELLAYARQQNATRILVGKPTHPRWRDRLFGSLVDEIVRGSADIDVQVVTGASDEEPVQAAARPRSGRRALVRRYLLAAGVVALCTGLGWALVPSLEIVNLVMVYLLGVVLVAASLGSGPATLASVLGVAAFDFCFVPPHWTFAVTDVQYLVTFGIMLAVGLLVSTLTARLAGQVADAREREHRTRALHELARDFARVQDPIELTGIVGHHIQDVFQFRSAVLIPDAERRLQQVPAGPTAFRVDEREAPVAHWVFERGRPAGQGTDTLPAVAAFYLPLVALRGTVGVLGVRPKTQDQRLLPNQRELLEAFANQTALALERAVLAEEAHRARLLIENERLRSALLSSVSHDLRTPLATMTGVATSLLQDDALLSPAARHDLVLTLKEEAERLSRQIRNLLDMTRIEAGAVELQREWQPLEELVGAALTRLEQPLGARPVMTRIPEDLPLVFVDGPLLEQVLVNLIENAVKFTPAASPLEISARANAEHVELAIADRGPGIPEAERERIFEKFYRIQRAGAESGSGLGLVICRAILTAHGGRIWAENRPDGGAVFRVTLPRSTPPKTPTRAELEERP
jgi:two-component system sensor histidine kinase KdpD